MMLLSASYSIQIGILLTTGCFCFVPAGSLSNYSAFSSGEGQSGHNSLTTSLACSNCSKEEPLIVGSAL